MHTSIDFLTKYRPGGPWLLVAVHPDKKVKRLPALTFNQDQLDKMEKWITTVGKGHNIYFSVNPTKEAMTKKAKREDIQQMDWLHVDVDPRAGEDFKEEQERILAMFREYKPVPTILVFSGGGYQAFWKLTEPIITGGDLALSEDAKRYNVQLETLLGGDNCHNIDRIMRLPGTMNRPNDKKKALGRVEVMAELVHFDDSLVYPISKFTAAPMVQSRTGVRDGSLGGSIVMPEISGNVKRLDSVDDLPDRVKAWVKVLIIHGVDPDNPNKFESRSHALFCVACELVRAGVSPEVIFSVITDPDFKISASVLELGSSAEAYALKQIKSASEQAIAPELMELNNKHAVISSLGGKCRVISREWDHAFHRTKIVTQSFADISNRYMNRKILIGKKKEVEQFMPLGKWWLEHADREQFDTMVFIPGKETPKAFNLWQGFNCEAKPGDCDLFLTHIRENICSGNLPHYEYLMKWLAASVQQPDTPVEVAVVLRGKQGTGKGVFCTEIGHLFGQHFLQVTNSKHLIGNFNNHLRDCVFLFGDEAFYAGDKAGESILKGLVTEKQFIIESKGIDCEFVRNFLHIIMASNSEWCVPVGMDDRRFFVLDVSEKHKEDRPYFKAMRDQLKHGGYEALLHHLLTYDLSGFDFDAVPKTEALAEQKALNMTPEESWWHDKLQEGQLLPEDECWKNVVAKERLFLDYVEFVKRPGSNLYQSRCTKTRMTQFMNRFLPLGYPKQQRMSCGVDPKSEAPGLRFNTQPVCYMIPGLQDCRDAWDVLAQSKTPWQHIAAVEGKSPF